MEVVMLRTTMDWTVDRNTQREKPEEGRKGYEDCMQSPQVAAGGALPYRCINISYVLEKPATRGSGSMKFSRG